MVWTGNPNEREKESFFFTKTVPIVIFIFHLMLLSNLPKCTNIARTMYIFLEISSKSKKFNSKYNTNSGDKHFQNMYFKLNVSYACQHTFSKVAQSCRVESVKA